MDRYEESGVLSNRWNGPLERETRSAHRRAASHAKGKAKDKATTEYQALTAEADNLDQNKRLSLEREKLIAERLKEIKNQGCSLPEQISERTHLRKECDVGRENRRECVSQKKDIKARLEAMKDGPFKIGRTRGHRPSTSTINETLPPDDSDPVTDDGVVMCWPGFG